MSGLSLHLHKLAPPGAPEDAGARLEVVVETLRELSRHTDPQQMVAFYGAKMRDAFAADSFVALSRRNVPPGHYRVTRSSRFREQLDPWKNQHRLPVFQGGILGELIYGDRPRLIQDFRPDPADPAFEHLQEMRSLAAIPQYDQGVAMNMVVTGRRDPGGFDPDRFPELVMLSGLFGRATLNLALARDLRESNALLEQELQTVARIQRSLLPAQLPDLPGLALATHYQPSGKASGDLFDFFPLPGDRLGILIADVSGHGTPAAVVMAVVHALAHSLPGDAEPAARVLQALNATLCARYTIDGGTFVTAFYAVYDPANRTLTYSSAGHNPPLLMDAETGLVGRLANAQGLPLGVMTDAEFTEAVTPLDSGDALVFYTDGITEARGPSTTPLIPMYGEARLEAIVRECAGGLCNLDAPCIVATILEDLADFAQGVPPSDDRTLVVAKVQ